MQSWRFAFNLTQISLAAPAVLTALAQVRPLRVGWQTIDNGAVGFHYLGPGRLGLGRRSIRGKLDAVAGPGYLGRRRRLIFRRHHFWQFLDH